MAEGYLRKLVNQKHTIYSAGVKPEPLNQFAIQVMHEIGIDISSHTSNHVDDYLDKGIDLVLTVCDNAKENCPVFPESVRKVHHSFTDPSGAWLEDGMKLNVYRKTRDEIQVYCTQLVVEISS